MTSKERDHRRKGKALYFSTLTALFSLVFKQGALHFHLALGLTNCGASFVHATPH